MITFNNLWDNFPDKNVIKAACQNKQPKSIRPFENYCAISLSDALIRSGISTQRVKAKKC